MHTYRESDKPSHRGTEVNGTNNLYPKNAVDIVHEETNPKVPSVKRKTKQSNKSKDISDRKTTR
jgi:hypothetical protein